MIGIAGCGALGSHIATFIAEPERQLILIDFDSVDTQNVITGTSIYSAEHVGMSKARVLSGVLYSRFGAINIPVNARIESNKAQGILKQVLLLIDCFDNIEARFHTCGLAIPTLHVGVSPQMIGAVEWDETYKLPEATEPEENEVCTHQLGRDLILLTSVVASSIIRRFLADGTKMSAVVNNRLEIIR